MCTAYPRMFSWYPIFAVYSSYSLTPSLWVVREAVERNSRCFRVPVRTSDSTTTFSHSGSTSTKPETTLLWRVLPLKMATGCNSRYFMTSSHNLETCSCIRTYRRYVLSCSLQLANKAPKTVLICGKVNALPALR